METARCCERPVGQLVWNTVVESVKKSDVLTCVGDLGRNAFERPRLAGKIRTVVNDWNLSGGR
jgi:hypothetical protein